VKLYLDDERSCPEGWVLVKTAEEAIFMLDNQDVEEISLDHDLGDFDHDPEWTGYTVLQHIESRVVWDDSYLPPKIKIHTANTGARPRMEAACASIERFVRLKQEPVS
jgi:hypothetical protein